MTALPHLSESGTIEQPSQIIAVSSLTGTCPLPKTTIYGKHFNLSIYKKCFSLT
jgi:hypothetical protein